EGAQLIALPVGICAGVDVGELPDLLEAVAITIVDFAEIHAAEVARGALREIVVGVNLLFGRGRFFRNRWRLSVGSDGSLRGGAGRGICRGGLRGRLLWRWRGGLGLGLGEGHPSEHRREERG